MIKEGKGVGHRIMQVLMWTSLPCLVLAAFYLLVVFRLQLRPINDVVRVFNKRLLNPVMMALDRRHSYAAVLKHKGRRSRNEYTTPVTVGRAGDSFVIPLSYGEEVDWLKNVRAAGRCSIETSSGTYVVGDPDVIDRAHALAIVPRHARMMFRLFGIERYVKVKRISEPSAEAKATAGNCRGEEGPPTPAREYRHSRSSFLPRASENRSSDAAGPWPPMMLAADSRA